MAYEFRLPELGEGVVEGEIVKWLVSEGDTVAEDQPLVELMTDKATVQVPSPRAGRVASLEGAEGDVVEVGQVLVVLDTGDGQARATAESAKAPAKKAGARKAAAAKEAGGKKAEPAEEAATEAGASEAAPDNKEAAPEAKEAEPEETAPSREAAAHQPETPPARLVAGLPARSTAPLAGRIAPARTRMAGPAARRVAAAPTVRRRARELGVDLQLVQGSGEAGRVTAADVESAARGEQIAVAGAGHAPATKQPQPPYNLPPGVEPPPPGGERRVPLRGLRKRIAEKMHLSKSTAAHFTFVEEVDMRRLVRMREDLKEPAAEKGARLTFMPFFVKAAAIALQRHPQLNLTLDEKTQELVYRGFYNIGIAVATDRGLMVVTLRDAEKKSLLEIALELDRLADEARSGKVKLEDLTGSTFTITSLGAQGGLFATPVINFPEVAIMGIHQIKDRPIVEDGAVVPGKVMLLSLSFDHRLVDGHVGAAFAYEVIGLLERPDRLFLELK